MNEVAYKVCWQRLESDPAALRALMTLRSRGSLNHLSSEGFEALNSELIHWLLRAENHAGSEIIYTVDGKTRGLPLGSFFDFPDHYAAKIPTGAFVSAETQTGSSIVLYVSPCHREELLRLLELAQQEIPLNSDRTLRERVLDNLRLAGHLSCLSAEGLAALDARMAKYLDYAVNVRPGSELIYFLPDGEVRAEALERALQHPEAFVELIKPVYLAIEIDDQSVLFDTHDLSPANLWRLQKKARQVVNNRS